jgi:hypothetical protein
MTCRWSLPTVTVATIMATVTVLVLSACAGGHVDRAAPATASQQVAPASSPGWPGPSSSPRWTPRPGASWQWQLTTPVDTAVNAEIFDIDGFDNGPDVVRALHQQGRRVICYVEVGAAEDYRPDISEWPVEVLGRPNGWPGERWVDVRRLDLISAILAARFDMCRAKGFDAVEPDVMDAFAADTGFPITATDQIAFNRFVAGLAHQRGLAVALKNDVEQTSQLMDDFDFAVNEECAAFDECPLLSAFVAAGKAVLHTEYDLGPSQFCPITVGLGFSSIQKHRSLDAYRVSCR